MRRSVDPLVLEMILQRERFYVGSPAKRGSLAEDLAKHGMTTDQLNLLIAYHEDRAKQFDGENWRAVCIGTLGKPVLWQAIVADLDASPGRGGKHERAIRADLDMSGSGHDCQHGTARGHHCDQCDPQMPSGDRLERMRATQFERLVVWIMEDVRAGRPHPDDTPQVADQKKSTRRKIEALLRRYLMAVGGDASGDDGVIDREDREMLRNAIPGNLLARRISPVQRFPGEKVKRVSGAEMRFDNWKREANKHSSELWKTGPLVGRVELAEQQAGEKDNATAQPADAADEWKELTEGAF